MKNYEKVVELKKKTEEENAKRAMEAINYLYTTDKLITVKELMELTGLSRSYFYKNKRINGTLKKMSARQKSDGNLCSKNEVFNLAVSKSNEVLEKQVKILQRTCDRLKEENIRLIEENLELSKEVRNYK